MPLATSKVLVHQWTSKLLPVKLRVRLGAAGSVILCGLTVACASAPLGQRQKPHQLPGALLIPSASEGWQKCAKSPAALAEETDRAISWQKSSICIIKVAYSGDGRGTSDDQVFISGPDKFRLQYPYMLVMKPKTGPGEPMLVKRELVCNGGTTALWEGGKGVIAQSTTAKYPFNPRTTPLSWATDFPFQLFYALRPGVKPFAALVAAAQAPNSGVTARVEEKHFPFQGHIVHQYRLMVRKNNGGSVPVPDIQVTVDASMMLPVTIFTTGQLPGRPPIKVNWSASWGRVKDGKMKESYFTIPQKTKSTSKKA